MILTFIFLLKSKLLLEVESDQYRQMVANVAKAFNITQHPDPAVTLQAIERRIMKIKATKMPPEVAKDKKKVKTLKTKRY